MSGRSEIRLNVPPRVLQVGTTAFVLGSAMGLVRGGREASMRFLAENAHRPPTTVQGWYFYKKTKNYRVLLGGLKGAGKESARLTALSLGFVGMEQAFTHVGLDNMREIGAATATAAGFSLLCESVKKLRGMADVLDRLPMHMAGRTVVLGAVVGSVMRVLRV